MADEVVLIHRGRLVRQGPIADLTRNGDVLVEAADIQRLGAALKFAGLEFQVRGPHRLAVSNSTPERVGTLAFGAGIPLHGLTSAPARLEEAFLDMTQEELK